MKRGGPLKRRTRLERGSSTLKRTRLKPVSEKQKARLERERAAVEAHGAAFRAAIKGKRCIVCGKTDREARAWARRELGMALGHQAHHVIRQEVLKRLAPDHLWDPELAVPVCEEPCHRQHSSRAQRIPLAAVPTPAVTHVAGLGLLNELSKEYSRP